MDLRAHLADRRVLPYRAFDRQTLGHVERHGLLQIDVLAGLHGVNCLERVPMSQMPVTTTSGYLAQLARLARPMPPAPISPTWIRSLAPGRPDPASTLAGTKEGAATPAAVAVLRKFRRDVV